MKQQLTKSAIRESFVKLLEERSFDKITVKSIVEDCGLTRNTFYYYYEDIYDILDDILTDEITRCLELAAEGRRWRDAFSVFSDFLEKKPKLVFHLVKSPKWEELKVYLARAMERAVDANIDRRLSGRSISKEKRGVIRSVCCAAVGGSAELWLQSGNLKNISDNIEIMDELFGDCIDRAIERSIEK
ncbi:MAG: TetR family transcriptional regulator [Clostridiales bacterium]|nr:TetR family transcriptional regulator [Clostridiales bacterium]